jgi:hypothetical protein
MVEQILEVKKKLLNAKTEKDKTYYNRWCYKIDNQIDILVYKLYGLTDEDIKIVEGRYM